ncbi:MAG TPA: hypothetical protein VGI93_10270 [Steroidobacteraceae bacterium]|jgi:hypothetical protein
MDEIAGKWHVTLNTPVGERKGLLELKVNGNSLTGSLSDGEHHALISDGKIKGNQLTWSAKIEKPMRLTLKFSARIENGKISGSARHLLGSATFTGARA